MFQLKICKQREKTKEIKKDEDSTKVEGEEVKEVIAKEKE